MQINTVQTSDKEADRKARIKSKAGAAILQIAPEWKQRNLTARALELTEIIASGGTLTTAQQTELTAIKATWAQIAAIREASNLAEANGTLVADFNP